MPKVSVNILTKNRAKQLQKALESVAGQSFQDFEVVVVDDGSTDNTESILKDLKIQKLKDLKIIRHQGSLGITSSRQEALEASKGEYVAILDDDDEWIDRDKLFKQVKYLDKHRQHDLIGGFMEITNNKLQTTNKSQIKNFKNLKHRPSSDGEIRKTMLFRNNFFTSTVMFRREAAISAGGFVKDEIDLGEDYDLWLRMGKKGGMHNFREAFTLYAKSSYNKEKFKLFLKKQLKLVNRHKYDYPEYWLARIILKLRMWF